MQITPNRNSNLRRHAPWAFTLVEMLLVLVILATLAALVYPNMARRALEARKVAAQAQIKSLRTALAAFEMDNDRLPPTHPGLIELVQRPRDAKNWKGPYMDNLPKDPWKNDFIYECPGRHNTGSYDIVCAGPDGVAGTEDDITSWEPDKH